jgi:mutator protein MutT
VSGIIVCAAIVERDGWFLVTRRQTGVHLAGYWEFPGGKCDAGETLAGCLARELGEELAVEARVGREVLTTRHVYAEQTIELHFLRCELMGEPSPRLGQEIRWVGRDELTRLPFPPADTELIRMLSNGRV